MIERSGEPTCICKRLKLKLPYCLVPVLFWIVFSCCNGLLIVCVGEGAMLDAVGINSKNGSASADKAKYFIIWLRCKSG